jgi:hypothetical protein
MEGPPSRQILNALLQIFQPRHHWMNRVASYEDAGRIERGGADGETAIEQSWPLARSWRPRGWCGDASLPAARRALLHGAADVEIRGRMGWESIRD